MAIREPSTPRTREKGSDMAVQTLTFHPVEVGINKKDDVHFAVAVCDTFDKTRRLSLSGRNFADRKEAEKELPYVRKDMERLVDAASSLASSKNEPGAYSPEVEETLDLVQDLISRANDLPEKAEDFAYGVIETLESMFAWIEKNHHVTDKQLKALDNMANGISQWEERI